MSLAEGMLPVRMETLSSLRFLGSERLVTGTGSLNLSVNIVIFLASYVLRTSYTLTVSRRGIASLCDKS